VGSRGISSEGAALRGLLRRLQAVAPVTVRGVSASLDRLRSGCQP
jgi:hypothetical protein